MRRKRRRPERRSTRSPGLARNSNSFRGHRRCRGRIHRSDLDAPVHLTEDEHFYSQKDYRIVVNAREVFVELRRLSYDQVVLLAFNPVPVGPDIIFTVTYRKGPRQNPKGTLAPGELVVIKNGMIFVVTKTNRS